MGAMATSDIWVDYSNYRKWLLTSHCEDSAISRLAFDLQQRQSSRSWSSPLDTRQLDTLLRSPEGRNKVLQWRYKPLNFDLLQFALACGDKNLLLELFRKNLYSAEHYRASGAENFEDDLMNHPLHLACFLGYKGILYSLYKAMGCPPLQYGYVWVGKCCMPSLQLRPGFLRPATHTVTGMDVFKGLNYDLRLLRLVDKVTNDPGSATASHIERLWNLASHHLCDVRWFEDLSGDLLRRIESSPANEDLLFLFCYILQAHPIDESTRCIFYCLFSSLSSRQVRCAAQFLRQRWISTSIQLLQKLLSGKCQYLCRGCKMRFELKDDIDRENKEGYLQVLDSERRERSLQQMCVLTVLESVEGNVRRLQALNLPKGLRRLFRIPFDDLYEKLTSK